MKLSIKALFVDRFFTADFNADFKEHFHIVHIFNEFNKMRERQIFKGARSFYFN